MLVFLSGPLREFLIAVLMTYNDSRWSVFMKRRKYIVDDRILIDNAIDSEIRKKWKQIKQRVII